MFLPINEGKSAEDYEANFMELFVAEIRCWIIGDHVSTLRANDKAITADL